MTGATTTSTPADDNQSVYDMNNILNYFDKIISFLEKVFIFISICILNIVMFLITIDVTLRYIINKPLVGVYEAVELSMIGLVFFGVAYLQSSNEHVNISIFVEQLNPSIRIYLSIFGKLIGLFAMTIIAISSSKATLVAFSNSEVTMGIVNIPIWPAKAIIPLGIGVLVFRIIIDLLKDLRILSVKTTSLENF